MVAIDNWSDIKVIDKTNRVPWDTFDLCKSVLGYSDEQCQRYTATIYEIEKFGLFDVVFCFGVFYHLRHPLLGLEKIAAVCSESLFIESAICDDYSPYNGKGHDKEMVMEFYPNNEYGDCVTNWWVPTMTCLIAMVESVGFKVVRAVKFDKPKELGHHRGFVRGNK